jgi:predicted RNA-binding Zn-ribbon protein involved in translation (DUF1610 family)
MTIRRSIASWFEDCWRVLVILGILFSLAGSVVGVLIADDQAETQWMQSEHTCPVCGWHGTAGQMKIVTGDDVTLFFCPECGTLLYEI